MPDRLEFLLGGHGPRRSSRRLWRLGMRIATATCVVICYGLLFEESFRKNRNHVHFTPISHTDPHTIRGSPHLSARSLPLIALPLSLLIHAPLTTAFPSRLPIILLTILLSPLSTVTFPCSNPILSPLIFLTTVLFSLSNVIVIFVLF